MMPLSRSVLIVGGSRGIGAAIVPQSIDGGFGG